MSEGLVWNRNGFRLCRVFAENAPRQTVWALYAPGEDECEYFATRREAEYWARERSAVAAEPVNMDEMKAAYLAAAADDSGSVRTMELGKSIREAGAELPPVPVTDVIIFDTTCGHVIVETTDRKTWCNFHGRNALLNNHSRDLIIERMEREQPQARIHHVRDFSCRIPAHLLRDGARVI